MGGGRSVIWLCVTAGSTVGGVIPMLWGASSLGGMSILFGLFGGIAGVFVGVRLSDV
jgi:hypothetical protein